MTSGISLTLKSIASCALLFVLGVGCSASTPVHDNSPPPMNVQAGNGGAGGSNLNVGGSGTDTSADIPNTNPGTTPEEICNVRPKFVYVIDGSGSMCASFGRSTRWRELRNALLNKTQGLIYIFQARAAFGMVLYDGTIDMAAVANSTGGTPNPVCAAQYLDAKGEGDCPQLIEIAPEFENAAAIDAAFPATELGGSTPTDKAMKRAREILVASRKPGETLEVYPEYIILATDGQPNDICLGAAGGDGTAQQQAVITEADRANMLGIKTYVISLAGGDAALEAHLNEVAKHGNPKNPDARTYTPLSVDELVNALQTLVNAALGCLQ